MVHVLIIYDWIRTSKAVAWALVILAMCTAVTNFDIITFKSKIF